MAPLHCGQVYRVAHMLAKESKPLSDEEFVRNCLQHIVHDIYPEKSNCFNAVRLACTIIMRRVDRLRVSEENIWT